MMQRLVLTLVLPPRRAKVRTPLCHRHAFAARMHVTCCSHALDLLCLPLQWQGKRECHPPSIPSSAGASRVRPHPAPPCFGSRAAAAAMAAAHQGAPRNRGGRAMLAGAMRSSSSTTTMSRRRHRGRSSSRGERPLQTHSRAREHQAPRIHQAPRRKTLSTSMASRLGCPRPRPGPSRTSCRASASVSARGTAARLQSPSPLRTSSGFLLRGTPCLAPPMSTRILLFRSRRSLASKWTRRRVGWHSGRCGTRRSHSAAHILHISITVSLLVELCSKPCSPKHSTTNNLAPHRRASQVNRSRPSSSSMTPPSSATNASRGPLRSLPSQKSLRRYPNS